MLLLMGDICLNRPKVLILVRWLVCRVIILIWRIEMSSLLWRRNGHDYVYTSDGSFWVFLFFTIWLVFAQRMGCTRNARGVLYVLFYLLAFISDFFPHFDTIHFLHFTSLYWRHTIPFLRVDLALLRSIVIASRISNDSVTILTLQSVSFVLRFQVSILDSDSHCSSYCKVPAGFV